MSLSSHLLIRITLVGLLCWLGVSAAVVWRLQREGRHDIEAQADRLTELTEQQLRRQLIAIDAGTRIPDLARIVATFGRPVCLRYKGHDVSDTVSWGCDMQSGAPAAPGWLDRWLEESGALPREVVRTVNLWSVRDGTLTVRPARAAVIEGLWQRLLDLAGITAATIAAVNVLVWFALRRLLRPTRDVLAALDRLGHGDTATRPVARGPREFRRIFAGIDALRASLAQLTAQRGALTAKLIDSQETERRDLARELHDEMGQGLAALQALSGGIRMSAQALEPPRSEDTDALDETIAQLHGGLRALLGRLRPTLLESQGMAFTLRELVNAWNARQRSAQGHAQDHAPLLAELHLPAEADWADDLPERVALALYRATQEALTNAARYALAGRPVEIAIRRIADGSLELDVTNPCHPGTAASAGAGVGLRMLAERLASLGGSLAAGQAEPGTYQLRARWPLRPTRNPEP